jgi:hypothetical protein
MQRSLTGFDDNVRLIADRYDGTLLFAEDLLCHVVE